MSRKKEPAQPRREADSSAYYRLNTKAVDDLVNANRENSPKVSEEELKKYGAKKKSRIPSWFKILFMKFWFPAAVCFFFLWGLGAYVPDMLDLLFITALALGIVTDLLTNNALRFFSRTEGSNDRWMMYPGKGFITFPLNMLHSCVIMFLIFTFYNALNRGIIAVAGLSNEAVPLGVEPLLFGLLYMGFDSLLIFFKHLLKRILDDAKAAAGR